MSAQSEIAESAKRSNSEGGTDEPPTKVHRSTPSTSLQAEIKKLTEIQEKCCCKDDLTVNLIPYIEEMIRRLETGGSFVTWRAYVKGLKICDICFHMDVKHLRAECHELCCGYKRCFKCCHNHYALRCECGHLTMYENDLRRRFSGV